MGRLAQNAARQSVAVMSTAPTLGPHATPRAPMPPHIATTCVRRWMGKAASRRPSDAGVSSAPPMPWTARPAISTSSEGATVQTAEPRPNTATPARKNPADRAGRRSSRRPRAARRSRCCRSSPPTTLLPWSRRTPQDLREGNVDDREIERRDECGERADREDHPRDLTTGRSVRAVIGRVEHCGIQLSTWKACAVPHRDEAHLPAVPSVSPPHSTSSGSAGRC